MQRAHVSMLILVVAIIAAVIVAEWYFFDYRPSKALYELEGVGPLPEVSELSGSTAEIIECEDPEVGKFYTDADSCEEADLDAAESPPSDLQPED